MNSVGSEIIQSQIALRVDNGAVETVNQVLTRVAREIAFVDSYYGANKDSVLKFEQALLSAFHENKLWPSGRILNNAGSKQGQLGSCFVIPVEDDFSSIFESIRVAAECHRTGGGTGFDFSHLREKDANISTSEARGASGPVAWIELFNASTKTVMLGGKTRGANLGTLSVYHPDILEFIRCKEHVGSLSYFNLSVLVDDAFMIALKEGSEIDLTSPSSGQIVKRISAKKIWNEIAQCAWETGDPGLLFLDNINRNNKLIGSLGPIRATNPCGEHGLYPYEPSNLASINLAEFVNTNGINWDALADCISLGVRLLDNAIDRSTYPDPRIEQMAKANRRIGLGVMGFADLLTKLKVKYDSEEGLEIAGKLGAFIKKHSWNESCNLANDRGVFPNFHKSQFTIPVRNCAVTSIAPTGTISLIAGCSSGIEPKFAANYRKNIMYGEGIELKDNDLTNMLSSSANEDFTISDYIGNEKDGRNKSDQYISEIFRYAHDISPIWHVRMLGAWQQNVDNGVSKTINIRNDGTPKEIAEAFELSWKLGCKGVSAYREGSRNTDLHQVIDTCEGDITQSKLLTADLQ